MNPIRLALTTITDPAAAWVQLKARALPRRELWLALAAVVALSTLAAWTLSRVLGATAPPDAAWDMMAAMREQLEQRPVTFALVQFGWTAVLIGAATYIGRLFDGHARYDDLLLAMVWMKTILLVLQVVQVALVPVSLGLAAVLAMVETGLYLLLAVRLTQVAHGFRSPLKVGGVMLASVLIAILALALRLVLFGPAPPELP